MTAHTREDIREAIENAAEELRRTDPRPDGGWTWFAPPSMRDDEDDETTVHGDQCDAWDDTGYVSGGVVDTFEDDDPVDDFEGTYSLHGLRGGMTGVMPHPTTTFTTDDSDDDDEDDDVRDPDDLPSTCERGGVESCDNAANVAVRFDNPPELIAYCDECADEKAEDHSDNFDGAFLL